MKLKIEESNELKRALFGDYKHRIKTFAIFTAENPMGRSLPPEENNKRTERLKQMLSKAHLQYIPINGRFIIGKSKINRNYGDNKYGKQKDGSNIVRDEHSFIVINISLSETEGICQTFEQLSFFFGEQTWTNENGNDDLNTASIIYYYETKIAGGDYKCVDSSRRIDNAQDFDNFFSRHKSYKYSIYMKIFNESYDSLKEILDLDCLMEAISNDDYVDRHRSMRRFHAYNGTFVK